MTTKSQQPKGREGAASLLNAAIEAMNHPEKISSIQPAKAAFDSARGLLTMIRVGILPVHVGRLPADLYSQDSRINDAGYVELGLACAEVCEALDRGMNGSRVNQLSRSITGAIEELTT